MPAAPRVHLTSSSPETTTFAQPHGLGFHPRFSTRTASRGWVISARQAFLNVAALQLARPPGRSAPLSSTRGLLRSSLLPIRYLLDSRVCYPADWSTAGAGLAPARKAALSAALGIAPTGRLVRVSVYIPTSSLTGIAWSLPRSAVHTGKHAGICRDLSAQ